MSKIKNGGLDQYGAGPFEQQQFGTAGVEGVNVIVEQFPSFRVVGQCMQADITDAFTYICNILVLNLL